MGRTDILLEHSALRTAGCPLGIYVQVSPENPFVWSGVCFVHRGYWRGGVFKFWINISPNYPRDNKPPQVYFTTELFHPLVDQTSGEMNLSVRFPTWSRQQHHISNVLHFIKASFKRSLLDSLSENLCFNREAYSYRDHISVFSKLAAQSANLSNEESTLFNTDTSGKQGQTQEQTQGQNSSSNSKLSGYHVKQQTPQPPKPIKFTKMSCEQVKEAEVKRKQFLEST